MASNPFSARRGFRYSEGKTEGKAHLHGKELGNWNEGEKGKLLPLRSPAWLSASRRLPFPRFGMFICGVPFAGKRKVKIFPALLKLVDI